jgi:hypothetical protein
VPGADDDEGDNKDDDHYQTEGLKFLAARSKCVPGSIASQPGHAIIVAERARRDWFDREGLNANRFRLHSE